MTRSGRHDTVVMLTRLPRPGHVKTRLTPALTAAGATQLHDRLARHTLDSLRPLGAGGGARVEVHADAGPRQVRTWLGRGFAARPQAEGDLGDRIAHALTGSFTRGAGKTVVVGSDCPRMSAARVRSALASLNDAAVVLGPAVDGGYYLVGVRRDAARAAIPALTSGIEWGASDVLARTRASLDAAAVPFALLETLPDVDRPADVADALAALEAGRLPPDARVSVVIPTLDDETLVVDAVASAVAAGAFEVLVADGGSSDSTVGSAARAGATVIETARGRAAQMNAGAARATGEVLLFLHADTVLPSSAVELAVTTLERPGIVAGAFGFAVPPSARGGTIITSVGRARSRITRHPYGDQGLFMTARTFRDLGGYPDIAVMEDYELVSRLRRLGRVEILSTPAVTSARAWERHGLLRPTAANLAVIGAYRLGVPAERLARMRAGATAR